MIIIVIDHSPAVLLPDVLEHVDVEGRVEGDVRHQLQRLLAHHRLLVTREENEHSRMINLPETQNE